LAIYWDQRFLQSKRGQLVALLRRSEHTVEELARALDLTDNGVRAHLAILERDGLVRQRGSVRRVSGGGKPAFVYELTSEAENLFPKGYEPVLRRLLDVLTERLGPDESEALLRTVGSRMAQGQAAVANGTRARFEAAVEVLNELGGLAELEEHDGGVVIRGYSCPLAAVTPDHPEMCRMAKTLLTELVGVPVHEHCERGERPRCCFKIALPNDTSEGSEEGR
jgi:predicted ArsR family transcriptional regulator